MAKDWFTPEDVVAIILGERNVVLEYYGDNWRMYDFYDRLQNALEFDAGAIAALLRARAREMDPNAHWGSDDFGVFDVEMALVQDLDLGATPSEVAKTLLALADAIERYGQDVAKVFEQKAAQLGKKLGIY